MASKNGASPRAPSPLTEKQALFAAEYPLDLNGTQAVIRAGYSETGASVTAVRLLANPRVQALIAESAKKRFTHLDLTADDIVAKLRADAFADPRDVVTWGEGGIHIRDSDELTPEQAATIAEIRVVATRRGSGADSYEVETTTVKLRDHTPALMGLAKHLKVIADGAGATVNLGGDHRELHVHFDGGPDA